MSAKHSKKGPGQPAPKPVPADVSGSTNASTGAATATAESPPSWLDSSDPRKRMWGKIIFIGVWIYVGALCLLALDQTFGWGIFGPKVAPLP